MGKRGGIKKTPNVRTGFQNPISLREESIGLKQTKGGSKNSKSILKVEHLQKLASWASGEAAIPSLGAFFGRRLATITETVGVLPDSSLFSCERCETILQPGFNCTVRIEKNRAKARRRRKKKTNNFTQNYVVYKCHFCSHWNLKRGTPKGHIKEICPSKAKTSSKSETAKPKLQKCSSLEKTSGSQDDIKTTDGKLPNFTSLQKSPGSKDDINKTDDIASQAFATKIPTIDTPATPLVRNGPTLLGGKSTKRNRSKSKKPAGTENNSTPTEAEKNVSMSNKRRRKSWTSLKEIAEGAEHDSRRNISNLTIPFCL